MTTSSVSTTNLTSAATLDDVLGNQAIAGVRRTRRVAFSDFSLQMASSGSVASALNVLAVMATSGRVTALLSQLTALPGWTEGLVGFVFGDAAGVNGEYLYTGGHLVWQQPLPGDVATSAMNAAIAAAAEVVALLNGVANGDMTAVAVPLWRWEMALLAISPATLLSFRVSLPGELTDPISIAVRGAKPVKSGGEIWIYTQRTLLFSDEQMTALMASALAIAL